MTTSSFSPNRLIPGISGVVIVAVALALAWAPGAAAQDRVNVNAATQDQLEALPGIGAKIASEIVRERDENGPYTSIDDLQRVPSMTPGLLAKLRGLVVAGGPGAGMNNLGAGGLRDGGNDAVAIHDGKVVTSDAVKRVLMRFAGEPNVREVQQQTIDYVKVNPDVIESWRGRARASGLAPMLTTTGQGTVGSGARDVNNTETGDSRVTDSANAGRLTVQARWELDRLIFEPGEMDVAREAVRMANLRDRVLDDVTRRYFERRRLQVELELTPPTDLNDRIKKELRLQELTADIDALTGGWFGQKLDAAGRAPY